LGPAWTDLGEDSIAPTAVPSRSNNEVSKGGLSLSGSIADDATYKGALAAILEEAVGGVRHELGRAEDVAKPALIVLVARNQTRRDRAALGFAEQCCRARGHALDWFRSTLDFFDVDTWMQIFRHGDSPGCSQ